MKLKNFVSCATVASILKNGGFNDGYRLIDCTSRLTPRPNHEQYKETLYGEFDKLMATETRQKKEYLKHHIPEAVHMDVSAATFPSEYAAYTLYPPRIFQRYARLLGINVDDQLVLYGRGALGGMMMPSNVAWLFKSYGHENVSVLDGGFHRWEKEGGEVTDKLPVTKYGNWKASGISKDRVVTFEELDEKDSSGLDLFAKMETINFLDARTRGQFEGTEPTGLDHHRVKGSNVGGARSVPVVDFISNEEGFLKPRSEIRKWIESCGYEKTKPIITSCNRGFQAAMLAMVLEYVDETLKPRVYFGSIKEIELRDPLKISSGHDLTCNDVYNRTPTD
ncbi:Putative thiosulfate sulfurtransferase [Toxocara canis]|uniref:Putative thiosulfate sulfurtransferase n=1 Tax=Toxocara canis TaxID=6265 RepID=A0A0B2V3I6_TOXCA|nr:Putative thiosulfate sulfurtransferase [Toxocara canis]